MLVLEGLHVPASKFRAEDYRRSYAVMCMGKVTERYVDIYSYIDLQCTIGGQNGTPFNEKKFIDYSIQETYENSIINFDNDDNKSCSCIYSFRLCIDAK
jgi:hypothetical protein